MPTTNALTTGVTNRGWYGNSERWDNEIAMPITATGSSNNYLSLPFKLPARCRAVWFSLANGTLMSYTGNDGTNTAACYAIVAETQSSLATGSTAATASNIVFRGGTTLAAGTLFAGTSTNYAVGAGVNTTSSDQWLFVVPAGTGTGTHAAIYNTGTGTSTAGFKFAATGNVNVKIYFEKFVDVATNTAS